MFFKCTDDSVFPIDTLVEVVEFGPAWHEDREPDEDLPVSQEPRPYLHGRKADGPDEVNDGGVEGDLWYFASESLRPVTPKAALLYAEFLWLELMWKERHMPCRELTPVERLLLGVDG